MACARYPLEGSLSVELEEKMSTIDKVQNQVKLGLCLHSKKSFGFNPADPRAL